MEVAKMQVGSSADAGREDSATASAERVGVFALFL